MSNTTSMNGPLTSIDRLRLFATDPEQWPFDRDDAENVLAALESMKAAGIAQGLELAASTLEEHPGREWTTGNDGVAQWRLSSRVDFVKAIRAAADGGIS